MSSDGGDIVLTAIGLFAGIGIFRSGFVMRKKFKLIESTPRSKIRSVAVGQVEVHGKAQILDQPLTSLFAQVNCVYYNYSVEERRKSGKSHTWVTIAEGSSENPFYLRDETGQIIIEPGQAELHLKEDRKYHLGSFSSSASDLTFRNGLNRLGITGWGSRPLRCQEIYISEGDPLFIFGTAVTREDTIASSQNENNLVITESPGNWFAISDHSESDVLSSLRWKTYLSVYGGPLLTIGCLLYLLNYFNILF